jgi:HD-GYP domain-containing protein (c-di-GMP phosphodiesterase class II)
MGIDAALKEIQKNRGKTYNAEAVDACIRQLRKKGFTFSGLSI